MDIYTVIGLIPVNKRKNRTCAFCGTNLSVKYLVQRDTDKPFNFSFNCCNKCVTKYATFVRTRKPYSDVKDLDSELSK